MSESTPTVVLVHGAFADGSSWNGVIERLQARGIPAVAPANPLRGIVIDSAYVAAASTDAVLNSALVPRHYPAPGGGDRAVEFAIDPAKFRDAFAADVPAEQTALMAATQRPITDVDGSHVVMVSQPDAVTDVILEAVAATSKEATHVAAHH